MFSVDASRQNAFARRKMDQSPDCEWRSMALGPARAGYTLVEMLLSVTLTLIMMGLVVQIFGMVGRSINDSRATLEMSGRLRSVAAKLRTDLQSVTVDMMPPARPEENKGYFEYTEGRVGPVYLLIPANPSVLAECALKNTDEIDPATGYLPDTSAADNDDVLMFTVRSRDEPFVGRVFVKTVGSEASDGSPFAVQHSAQSPLAEVAWFVRGRTLYRRVLLIMPSIDTDLRPTAPGVQQFPYTQFYYDETTPANTGFYGNYFETVRNTDNRAKGFYNNFDLSVRLEKPDPANNATWYWAPNTLGDLTKPENRFAHESAFSVRFTFFHPHMGAFTYLGLPTLRECSHFLWPVPGPLPILNLRHDGTVAPPDGLDLYKRDLWKFPLPYTILDPPDDGILDPETGTLTFNKRPPTPPLPKRYLGPRIAEDVILDNVIGFDVKAWDANAPLLQPVGQAVVLAPGDPGYPKSPLMFTRAQCTALTRILNGDDPNWIIVGRGAYVDLHYAYGVFPELFRTAFSTPPPPQMGTNVVATFYDTWSTHYEHDGVDQNPNPDFPLADSGTNGFDDIEDVHGVDTDGDGIVENVDGIVDDPGEADFPPPFPVPLRGIQVKIRVFEPDSRQIREVTIIQDFLPQ